MGKLQAWLSWTISWQRVERIGLLLLIVGLAGIVMLITPWIIARYYSSSQELPVLNLPLPGSAAVGMSHTEYETQLADANDQLTVPGQGIRAALVEDVPLEDEAAYWQALTRGVAVARSSAPLDALTGNTVLFGHSGRLTLKPSPYDSIFAKLSNVKVGDDVVLRSHGVDQRYVVTSSRSINADAVSVLEATSGKRTVTLITCWPLGTWYKRWVVVAELVAT